MLLLRLRKATRSLSRSYHYTHDDVYGFRSPRPVHHADCTYQLTQDSDRELQNRIKNANLLCLVDAYRSHGHRLSNLDPLNLTPLKYQPIHLLSPIPELDPKRYGLKSGTPYDLEGILRLPTADSNASLESILGHLQKSYTSNIGFEFAHLPFEAEKRWFIEQIESKRRVDLTIEEKKYMFSLLTKSEVTFEPLSFIFFAVYHVFHRVCFFLDSSSSRNSNPRCLITSWPKSSPK